MPRSAKAAAAPETSTADHLFTDAGGLERKVAPVAQRPARPAGLGVSMMDTFMPLSVPGPRGMR